MSVSKRERNLIIGATVAIVIIALLAFFLGRGCGDERTTTGKTGTATSTERDVTATAIPEPSPEPEPEPELPPHGGPPGPTPLSLSVEDASWGCAAFASDPGNEGCITGSPVDWMALISGGDPVSVTVTISGPEPTTTVSLNKGGLHDPGSPAIEWYGSAPAPMTKGVYNYLFTIIEAGGTTTVIDSDPMLGPFTLPVAIP